MKVETKKYLVDLAERMATTATFTFLSVFSIADLSTAKTAAIAAGAACLSLLKGAVAQFVGDESPGLKK